MNSPLIKKNEPIITLLTDFGEQDWFVGSMKGVLASLCPSARLVDITHQISPGNIKQGALVLKCAYRFFPRGTINMVVVDPGVGTERAVAVMEGGGYLFLAPDNGVLSYVMDEIKRKKIYRVTREEIFLKKVSSTFHGRDIFSPIAAQLAGGMSPEELGPELEEPVVFPIPSGHRLGKGQWTGVVIYIDRFGNAITSISRQDASDILDVGKMKRLNLIVSGRSFRIPLASSYASLKQREPLAIWGSCGYLELAVSGGNASKRFGLKPGDEFILEVLR